ncbi:MAG: TrkH family potassium uptake protein [Clostridia bacterium]|nr:TrkH family potassium uptake protein [Clostridia bacterium]
MNYRMISKLLAVVLQFVTIFMVPALTISIMNGETAAVYGFLITMAVMLVLSLLPRLYKLKRQTMYARDGYVLVTLTWLLISLLGALPFWISGAIPNYVDCFFEVVSGFTTTGASILTDVEAMPKGLLYWRSFSHWLGGMGVLVFLLAITRFTEGAGDGMHIMRAESPGPQVSKLVPHTFRSAQILYLIYIGLTVVQAILLLAGGMDFFEAICIAFGTAGTGGFGVRNDSLASYTPYIQWVVTVFMALFGVNFGVYYLVLLRSFRKAFRNEELWMYLGIMLTASAIIFLNILPSMPGRPADAIRHSCFQVASIMTTTGYGTADFNLWPQLSRSILVMLMLVGASAGSTGGGIKVSRVLILVKCLFREIHRMLHPNTVRQIHMDGEPVPREAIRNAYAFLTVYCLITVGSMLLVSLDNFSFETNLTAVFACLNNIGPGLDQVGPTSNFSAYSNFSKIVLSVDMLLGRLEIFPIIITCMPSVWKRARV